jgi:ubiquinone/menaquinone biosynthesis C-methylase UbiE
LGPLLFRFSAEDLARRVGGAVASKSKILEVACGTGISTEYLRRATDPTISILATDLNEAMLDYARKQRGSLVKVQFERADAQSLPFDSGSFDAVVCQFGIMFFPEKAQAFSEFARVLRPGGVLAYNVWDSLTNNPVAKIAHETIAGFFDSDPPNFLEVPFGFYDIAPNLDLIRGAGLEVSEVDTVAVTIDRDDSRSVATGFIEGNPAILQIRERATVDPRKIVDALAEAIEVTYGPPPLRIPLREIVFVARKP